MYKKIISALLCTTITATSFSANALASPIGINQDASKLDEYISDINKVKPSEATDDYEINFKSEAVKKQVKSDLKLESEDVTIGDIKKYRKTRIDFDFEGIEEEVSLEGLQYLPNTVTSISLKNGKVDIKSFDVFRSVKLKSINLVNMGLKSVPKIEGQDSITRIDLSNNKISDIENISYYKNLSGLLISRNQITDISELSKFDSLENIELNENRISDISPIKSSANTLSKIEADKNKINNESFANLMSVKYPNLRTAYFAYNNLTDIKPAAILKDSVIRDFKQGKQNAVLITEDGKFSLDMINFVVGGKGKEIVSVKLDENESITLLDNTDYELTDKSKIEVDLFHNERFYRGNNQHMFSLYLKVINTMSAKQAVDTAVLSPSEENILKANIEIDKLKAVELPIEDDSLEEKITEYENKLLSINDYVSEANPTPPHSAPDDLVVNFTDDRFKKVIQNTVKHITGEHKDEITVGDMKLIEMFSPKAYALSDDPTVIVPVNNIEGLQYAINMKFANIKLRSKNDIANYDENYNILNPEEVQNEGIGKFNETKFDLPKEELEQLFNDIKEPKGLLNPIRNIKTLESLSVYYGGINSKDIEMIKDLKELKHIFLNKGNISDLKPFNSFPKLEELYLLDTLITDATPISSIKTLNKLFISGSRIENYDFLKDMNNLKELTLNLNRKSNFEKFDITPVGNLRKLEKLSLLGIGVEDISPIVNLNTLKELRLEGNYISDLSQIKDLTVQNNYNGNPNIVAYVQHVRVPSDDKGVVKNPLKDRLGKEIPLTDEYYFDPFLEKLGNGKYRIKISESSENLNDIIVAKEFRANDYKSNGTFSGKIFMFNKRVVSNIVKRAKENPINANIEKAYKAVEMLNPCLELRDYAAKAKAEIDALKPFVSPESVSLNKDKLTLTSGEKEKLTATVKPDNAINKEVTWSSSDDSIVKVDSKGNVEAVGEGKAKITATVKGTDIKATAEVTVELVTEEVKAKSIKLEATKIFIYQGQKDKIEAVVSPKKATNKEIEWSSSDDSIVKVDSKGNIEAVGTGTAVITATVKGTDIKATAEVTVELVAEKVKAKSIKLDATKIFIYQGQKDKIEAVVSPEKATNKEIEWSSSDDSIVKVDADGNIEAIGVGTVTITAKVKGTDITTSIEIISSEITEPINTKFIDIDDHWAKAYIEHSADRGLFKGITETLFSPELSMTRGMFVTVLGRLAEETAEPNDKFTDVNKSAYYAKYISWAEENGIVEGYGNGNFGPDNNVTREEMAAIIERYMKYKGIELEDNGAAAFADADSISDWAKQSVTKIQKAGIIEGKGNGVFDPQANSTRAEVATLLIRVIEKYID